MIVIFTVQADLNRTLLITESRIIGILGTTQIGNQATIICLFVSWWRI